MRKLSVTILAICCLQGCANRGDTQPNIDPLEPINRQLYKFNDVADRYVLRPAGKGYNAITPEPVRRGIGNFFDNVSYPVTIVNDALQAKWAQTGQDLLRLLINSTFGLFGFLDVATDGGLERHEEDFGQTFATWGIPSGPYIVVPILGPRTFRSGIGTLADVQVNPLVQYDNSSIRDKLLLLWIVETRAALIGPDELVQDAFDPYLFLRDAYLQNREFLINDGVSQDEEFFDEEFEDF